MIFYLCTSQNSDAMAGYLGTWGEALAEAIQIIPYPSLLEMERLPGGTYIFTDVERLTPAQLALAGAVCEQLSAAGPAVRILNDPRRVLARYPLLRALRDEGRNGFDARPALEPPPARLPVFIRHEHEHDGSLTDLLLNEADRDAALLKLALAGKDLRDLLVVEFLDIRGADGLFRKYSAFFVGGRTVPRHLIFSRRWLQKQPELLDEAKVAEERRYLEENPHRQAIEAVFARARIDYGRIDYGLLGGQLQVWEINTNPIVLQHPNFYHALHRPAQDWFAPRIKAAFEAIDLESEDPVEIPIRLGLDQIRAALSR